MIGGRPYTDRTTLIKGGYVLTLDPELGDLPHTDVLIDGDKIAAVGPQSRSEPERERHRRAQPHRDAGLRRHAPAHLADARARRAAELHARSVLLGHARQHRHPVPRRGRLHREPHGRARGLNGGITTLLDWSHVNNTPEHADAAIAGLAEAGIRAVYAHGPPVGASTLVGLQLEGAPRGRAPHPQAVLQLRRSAADARARGARARQHDARGRDARLAARARSRHPHQRPRRHAARRACTCTT